MVVDHSLALVVQRPALRNLDHSPISNFLNTYLLSCKVDEKASGTLDSYCERISRFIKFLQENQLPLDVEELTNYHVRLFLQKLRDTGLQGATINVYYRSLHTFFNWLLAENVTKNYPMTNIKPPRISRNIIKPFSLEDIRTILLLCSGDSFVNVRDRAIILVAFDTALRLSEIVNIQLNDVNFNTETIRVMGKGAKERTVRIGKITQKAILKYLTVRHDSLPCLWLIEERTPLTRDGIQTMVKRLCKRAAITDARGSPHTFRHSAAINFLRNGGS